jgi:hypothetical protein
MVDGSDVDDSSSYGAGHNFDPAKWPVDSQQRMLHGTILKLVSVAQPYGLS